MITAVILIINLFFFRFVYPKRDENDALRYYAYFIVCVFVWQIIELINRSVSLNEYAPMSWRISHASVIFLAIYTLFFTTEFVNKKIGLKYKIVIYIVGGIIALLNLVTDRFAVDEYRIMPWGSYHVPGDLYFLFAGWVGLFFALSSIVIFLGYIKEKNPTRKRMLFIMFLGVLISAAGGALTDLVFPFLGIVFVPLGGISTTIFAATIIMSNYELQFLDIGFGSLKIGQKIMSVIITFLIFFFLILALISFHNNESMIEDREYSRLHDMINTKRIIMDQRLDDTVRDLKSLIVLENIYDLALNKEDTVMYVERYIKNHLRIIYLSVLDIDGRVIYSSQEGEAGRLYEKFVGSQFLNNEYHINKVENDHDKIDILIPLQNQIDSSVYFILARIDLQRLLKDVISIEGLEVNGIEVIDETGYSLERGKDIAAQFLQPCITTQKGSIRYMDTEGEELFAAYEFLPDIGFCIYMDQKISKAIEPIREMNRVYLMIGSIMAVVIVLLSIALTREIIRPIYKLKSATEKLRKGQFDTRIDINTKDELGELGESFNQTIQVLEKMDQERKQLDHAKTEFISITSHELRSPMTPMKAQLQMLLGEYFGKLNEKQKAAADIVLRNTTRLDKIIVDFLEVSRIEAARLKFRFVKTNLTEHIDRLIQEMNGFMPEKNIKLEKDMGKLPIIEVDPDRVMQVLRNLINNAKKFSPDNSTIIIGAHLKDNEIFINVKDNGIGISAEDQTRVFEPFFQAEKTMYRKYGGTGLGLAICKGIVESQHGKIWLESAVGKGTVFSFTIPLKPVKEIEPIKLLFSPKEQIEEEIKKIFKTMLGPLGDAEFDELIKTKGLSKENLFKYIGYLLKLGIITDETSKAFSKMVRAAFGEKPEEEEEELKIVYLEFLGIKKGKEEYDKIKEKKQWSVIEPQIDLLTAKSVLSHKKAYEMKDIIKKILKSIKKKEVGKEIINFLEEK
ncbi:MAG: ATP-binding protein [Nanoarchaeota archaeon]